MAIVIESVTETTGGATSTSREVDMPATRPDGDLYIIIYTVDVDGVSPNTYMEAGWTQIEFIKTLNYGQFGVEYRIGSSEPASYTLYHPQSENSNAVIIRLSGAEGTPTITSIADSNWASASTKNVLGVTYTGNSLILAAVTGHADSIAVDTAGSLTQQSLINGSGFSPSLAVFSIQGTGGTSPTDTAVDCPLGTRYFAGITIAIQEAASGWSAGSVMGILPSNIAKINGIDIANIAKVNGI